MTLSKFAPLLVFLAALPSPRKRLHKSAQKSDVEKRLKADEKSTAAPDINGVVKNF
jgi:hypothetical protein